MTGVGGQRRGGRPRGVAFLAGPTGVGKTELAKSITELLFNDESAYIRFDMSEFSAEHADQRLIGAPPGYIGYDAGGELTNAIRERPFSVAQNFLLLKGQLPLLLPAITVTLDPRLPDVKGSLADASGGLSDRRPERKRSRGFFNRRGEAGRPAFVTHSARRTYVCSGRRPFSAADMVWGIAAPSGRLVRQVCC